MKLNAGDIEVAIARFFNPRMNLIVPNVSWGLNFLYELDLIIVKSSGYAWEVEIKTSISDLKAEKNKRSYAHCSNRIKRLYFAIPDYIQEKAIDLIPERAGILIVNSTNLRVKLIRTPKLNMKCVKLTDQEQIKLRELAAMRIWSLKEALLRQKRG